MVPCMNRQNKYKNVREVQYIHKISIKCIDFLSCAMTSQFSIFFRSFPQHQQSKTMHMLYTYE